MTYRRTIVFVASSLYFSFANQYSLGGGFPFPIVLVPKYKLSLCHTPIKPDLRGFPGIDVFAYGLRDHVIMRFASKTFRGRVKFQINWSSGRTCDISQNRLYKFCYLIRFDLWTSYLARILFL
jgi:hypothetical protein